MLASSTVMIGQREGKVRFLCRRTESRPKLMVIALCIVAPAAAVLLLRREYLVRRYACRFFGRMHM